MFRFPRIQMYKCVFYSNKYIVRIISDSMFQLSTSSPLLEVTRFVMIVSKSFECHEH